MGQFVAIRMIVLDYGNPPDEDPGNRRKERINFRNWMTGTFLGAMGGVFKPFGLEEIVFLEGNKVERDHHRAGATLVAPDTFVAPADRPVLSPENVGVIIPPSGRRAAGANADFAWITYWKSMAANKAAWQATSHPSGWAPLWKQFMAKCLPKTVVRPSHGPPFDGRGPVLAAEQNYIDNVLVPDGSSHQRGAGAGCLVEGFEVVYHERGGSSEHPWTPPEETSS